MTDRHGRRHPCSCQPLGYLQAIQQAVQQAVLNAGDDVVQDIVQDAEQPGPSELPPEDDYPLAHALPCPPVVPPGCKHRKTCRASGQAAHCLRRTLRVHRPGPHWCDGQSWGGNIWGVSRKPGVKDMAYWAPVFDPRLTLEEIEDIYRQRNWPPEEEDEEDGGPGDGPGDPGDPYWPYWPYWPYGYYNSCGGPVPGAPAGPCLPEGCRAYPERYIDDGGANDGGPAGSGGGSAGGSGGGSGRGSKAGSAGKAPSSRGKSGSGGKKSPNGSKVSSGKGKAPGAGEAASDGGKAASVGGKALPEDKPASGGKAASGNKPASAGGKAASEGKASSGGKAPEGKAPSEGKSPEGKSKSKSPSPTPSNLNWHTDNGSIRYGSWERLSPREFLRREDLLANEQMSGAYGNGNTPLPSISLSSDLARNMASEYPVVDIPDPYDLDALAIRRDISDTASNPSRPGSRHASAARFSTAPYGPGDNMAACSTAQYGNVAYSDWSGYRYAQSSSHGSPSRESRHEHRHHKSKARHGHRHGHGHGSSKKRERGFLRKFGLR